MNNKEYWKLSLSFGVPIVLICIIYGIIVSNYVKQPGIFGDQFGAITALFTGLAFAGLIITIIMQSKELKFQGDQLELQAKELKVQSEALTGPNDFLMTSNLSWEGIAWRLGTKVVSSKTIRPIPAYQSSIFTLI